MKAYAALSTSLQVDYAFLQLCCFGKPWAADDFLKHIPVQVNIIRKIPVCLHFQIHAFYFSLQMKFKIGLHCRFFFFCIGVVFLFIDSVCSVIIWPAPWLRQVFCWESSIRFKHRPPLKRYKWWTCSRMM